MCQISLILLLRTEYSFLFISNYISLSKGFLSLISYCFFLCWFSCETILYVLWCFQLFKSSCNDLEWFVQKSFYSLFNVHYCLWWSKFGIGNFGKIFHCCNGNFYWGNPFCWSVNKTFNIFKLYLSLKLEILVFFHFPRASIYIVESVIIISR